MTDNIGNFDYADKVDTCIDGPWTSEEVEHYIPRQYRGKKNTLLTWQQEVWDCADEWDPRTINFIYDETGNNGKSTLACLFDLHSKGIDLPPINDAKELIESVCDILTSKNTRMPDTLFMDMPRAMDKRKLGGLHTSIEQIKKGNVYDTRYRYREWWFDSPQI